MSSRTDQTHTHTHTYTCTPYTRAALWADLVQLVSTPSAEVVLTGQDDHRLGEDLQADGTQQLLLQRTQGCLPLCPLETLQGAQVHGQSHAAACLVQTNTTTHTHTHTHTHPSLAMSAGSRL